MPERLPSVHTVAPATAWSRPEGGPFHGSQHPQVARRTGGLGRPQGRSATPPRRGRTGRDQAPADEDAGRHPQARPRRRPPRRRRPRRRRRREGRAGQEGRARRRRQRPTKTAAPRRPPAEARRPRPPRPRQRRPRPRRRPREHRRERPRHGRPREEGRRPRRPRQEDGRTRPGREAASTATKAPVGALVVKEGEEAWTKAELEEVLDELHEQREHSAEILAAAGDRALRADARRR